jgi:hypothetical protein
MAIGRDDLGKPLADEKYPLLNILNAKGIRGLLDFASRESGFQPGKTEYIGKCDRCPEIRFLLCKNNPVDFLELSPREFYWSLIQEQQPRFIF